MAKSSSQTPLMRQYLDLKTRYEDAVLLFRLGDFYEMFYEDAVEVSKVLDLTLTTRDKNKKDPVPMCGIPHHTKDSYVSRLVRFGYKVAVCEQMEDPSKVKGIVRRDVTQVITPGVILDLEHLDARQANYLAAVWGFQENADGTSGVEAGDEAHPDYEKGEHHHEHRGDEAHPENESAECYGLALVDASTGELRITSAPDLDALLDELARCRPRELLLPQGCKGQVDGRLFDPAPLVEEVPKSEFCLKRDEGEGLELLARYTDETAQSLGRLSSEALSAASAAVGYLERTLLGESVPPLRLIPYERADYMVLDEATLTNLEVFETIMDGRKAGSLLGTIDETQTAMGGRLLREALTFPLQDLEEIARRHDGVSQLLANPGALDTLRKLLREINDLERLGRRVGHGVATPRDFAVLRRSLEKIPQLSGVLRGCCESPQTLISTQDLSCLDMSTDLLEDIGGMIAEIIVDEPPATFKDGGVIRRGYSKELDVLVDAGKGGRDRILAIEQRERRRTGISSLKVKYNKVFGYYIEVTKANLADVPQDYTRKQTLVNSERYITPELAEHEALVLDAEEKRLELEVSLFESFRRGMMKYEGRISVLARRVALVDLLCSFTYMAATHDYARPQLNEGVGLTIKDGRHPVVERHLETGTFVPNDTELNSENQSLIIVTGPNMAGKSTIIRQVALITLLAHTGSFVPAGQASIGMVDRIFTRVGASDNLAKGQSTFMVEMRETANILRYATKRSLVILDEIGRGTSTFDGMSLAWAVAEFLHDRVGARTLFATHYHELCELSRAKKRVKNFAVLVREWRDDIVFLHKLSPGGVNRSYGIQVARLAGLPLPVVERAKDILERLERGEALRVWGGKDTQLDLFSSEYSMLSAVAGKGKSSRAKETEKSLPPWIDDLRELIGKSHPDGLTPKEAHDLLYDLCRLLPSD